MNKKVYGILIVLCIMIGAVCAGLLSKHGHPLMSHHVTFIYSFIAGALTTLAVRHKEEK